jgi:hypothetical protein
VLVEICLPRETCTKSTFLNSDSILVWLTFVWDLCPVGQTLNQCGCKVNRKEKKRKHLLAELMILNQEPTVGNCTTKYFEQEIRSLRLKILGAEEFEKNGCSINQCLPRRSWNSI